MIRPIYKCLSLASLALVLSCAGSSSIISTPLERIDSSPVKISELSLSEKETWGHLDLKNDTIPGMSVNKAYTEIIKDQKGETVIVAVIDSGIDIEHEDLNAVIWTNKKEIPNNGIDDDQNGYVDDIHGWNFLGDTYNEQLEYVRLLKSGDTSQPRFEEAKTLQESEFQQYASIKVRYSQIYNQLLSFDKILSKHLGKDNYTKADVRAIKTEDPQVIQAVSFAEYMYSNGIESLTEAKEELNGAIENANDTMNYNLNVDFNGRTTGDNVNDINDINYGNGNVMPIKKSESHGTHVAGIIAADRTNNVGTKGVANNVEIMSVRAVPNGDEYDKDVALALRYAVDNGARVINGSFGKSFSPHSQWVRDAIAYAAKNDVLIVHAAGNESKDIDVEPNFPADNINGTEVADNYISVGALSSSYGNKMIAGFSNYGLKNVDVFAPGAQIYSTTPENEYKFKGGTSMAAPAVAGVAALVRSYYPKLSASQVKKVILESGLTLSTKVIVGGDASDVRQLSEISKTGRIVNAYNALILASQQ